MDFISYIFGNLIAATQIGQFLGQLTSLSLIEEFILLAVLCSSLTVLVALVIGLGIVADSLFSTVLESSKPINSDNTPSGTADVI